jgi:hypothetical protein
MTRIGFVDGGRRQEADSRGELKAGWRFQVPPSDAKLRRMQWSDH